MSELLAFRLRVLDEVTSTNDEVKRALEAGEPEGLALRARRQTGGYGRQGRAWASPEGGLYLSLLLRPSVDAALLPTLSLVTALAVRRAVAGLLPAEAAESVQVKWPNDLVVPAAGQPPEPLDAAAPHASILSPLCLPFRPTPSSCASTLFLGFRAGFESCETPPTFLPFMPANRHAEITKSYSTQLASSMTTS